MGKLQEKAAEYHEEFAARIIKALEAETAPWQKVHGGQRPAVPRVQRLKQVGGLGPAHLADDDVIGPVPQRVPHQVPDRHAATGEPARLGA